jgi:opacity protein-like surface antigen
LVRKACLLSALVFVASLPVRAQGLGDKIELSAGYSYMRFRATPAVNLNGWDLSGQYKLSDWLGIAADLGGQYGKVGGVSSRVYTYLFGPQVSWPRKVSPFGHILFGGAHFDGGGFASKSFAWTIGAGIDTRLTGRLSWRIIEGDVLSTSLGSNSQHNTRLSTGVVFRF